MRSRLVVLVVTAAVGWAGCVSQRPPERSELPRLADVIQPLAPCMVTVGEGDGAELVQVESDGAAAGVLEPGDVIRQVGGVTVLRVEDLLSTLRTWSPGDRVAVVFERDGETQSAELGLRSSPDDPDQPRLGVLVRTSYAAVAPADLPVDGIEPSATTRVVDLSGELLLFDPTSRRWQRLGMSTPEGDWLPAPGRIYLVEQTAAGATSALVELGSGTRTGLDLGDRPATSVLTMVGDLVLVTVSGETVVAIDPATGAPRWEWTPGDGPGGRALNPVTGFRSIDRSSALIALTEDPAAGQLSYTLVDAEGPVTDMETIPALDGMVVTG